MAKLCFDHAMEHREQNPSGDRWGSGVFGGGRIGRLDI
jgi:hypothetical protein